MKVCVWALSEGTIKGSGNSEDLWDEAGLVRSISNYQSDGRIVKGSISEKADILLCSFGTPTSGADKKLEIAACSAGSLALCWN